MLLSIADPIVVAPSPTPFRADDSVDYAAIERNVAKWLDTPLSGFVLNSENGEEAFLSEQEQLQIVRTVRQVIDEPRLIVAGVDSPSVTETVRKANACVDAGADLIRLRVPRLTAHVGEYFEEVIPRVAAPVVIIHQMAPGTFLSGPATIGAPAELIGAWVSMDNVFGYIASVDLRFEARVRTFVPAEKRFWVGNGSLLLPGVLLGANGACMMLGNVAPQACYEILCLGMQGRMADAHALQVRLLELDWQILARGAAGLKAALSLLGYETGAPRRPSVSCDADSVEILRSALKAAGLAG
jgi:dihydrodipicolinate synthase/N-acetylneuraminate lyase